MNKDIIILLNEYKEISLTIIKIIENNNYNSLAPYVDKRQDIVNKLISLNYNPKDYEFLLEELDIIQTEEKIKEVFNRDMEKVQKELKLLRNAKLANKAYNNNLYQNLVGLDVRI